MDNRNLSYVFVCLDVPASGVYFLTYEAVQNYITDDGKHQPSILGTIFSGGIAGIANWLVGMPADVLKSRLQTCKWIIQVCLRPYR